MILCKLSIKRPFILLPMFQCHAKAVLWWPNGDEIDDDDDDEDDVNDDNDVDDHDIYIVCVSRKSDPVKMMMMIFQCHATAVKVMSSDDPTIPSTAPISFLFNTKRSSTASFGKVHNDDIDDEKYFGVRNRISPDTPRYFLSFLKYRKNQVKLFKSEPPQDWIPLNSEMWQLCKVLRCTSRFITCREGLPRVDSLYIIYNYMSTSTSSSSSLPCTSQAGNFPIVDTLTAAHHSREELPHGNCVSVFVYLCFCIWICHYSCCCTQLQRRTFP